MASDRERKFCEEYVIDFNASRAATAAGFAATTASSEAYKTLKRPDVQEYIRFLKGEQTVRAKVNADYVLSAIVDTLERCKQEVKPVYMAGGGGGGANVQQTEIDKDGNLAAVYKYDAKSVLKAAELLGKSLAMFTDVVDQRMTFTQMPDVRIGTATGETKALSFDVGEAPNPPKAVS